ncbi:PREDICTED: structure-specific endonuclease subunit SLX4 [Condylura cristata]|uniref:structure-specific endonuclease subunit SLX4 n=1 Tax=Condylura cristata TaxID=143302 RepID=UPI000642DD0C|nr:PREDICTED: structure-specific endonuclease subunit SLX4 [Condylura cristata]
MDESDEDFKELCASFFQRVKKNGPRDASGERKRPKASNSTQPRGRPHSAKQTPARSTPAVGPAGKRARPGGRAPPPQRPAPPESGQGGACAPAGAPGSVTSTQTERAPGSGPQAPPSCLAEPEPRAPQRTAELVLQRMQRFKRADPDRLRRSPLGEEMASEGPQEGATAGQGPGPGLPVTESDAAVAWALQQELGQERAATRSESLEEKGLFFCQICQKNLSTMNVTRREQHVNRCLDEAEKAARPSAPQVPECPICGKPFLSPKSRSSHLKQCAAKMEVGPQLLLQAVRLQTTHPEGAPSLATPALSLGGGLKRKGSAGRKEPQKRRRVSGPAAPSEDLLVAMALSRSELEARLGAPRPGRAAAENLWPGAEKKSRKQKAAPPPQLLAQDAETTGRQIEDRVAQLLAEEAEVASTPPLPTRGRLRGELERASWCLQPPAGKQQSLWEGSALTQAWALGSFYTASLVPPLEPRPAAQVAPPCTPEAAGHSLSLLAADLGTMVNNPQLSDVQIQTDSGELLHAHKFVLYARCPLLMQHVRAACGLRPPRRLARGPQASSSAAVEASGRCRGSGSVRFSFPGMNILSPPAFGVPELARLCGQALGPEGGRQVPRGDEDCESRAEAFQELLRAMWAGEEAPAAAAPKSETCGGDGAGVEEAEMEEVYALAATQRKLLRPGGAALEEQSGPLAAGPGGVRAPPTSSPGLAAAAGSSAKPSGPLLGGRCSGREEAEDTPRGAPRPPSPAGSPGGCRAEKEAGSFLFSVDTDDEQPFLLTQGGSLQTPRISSSGEEGSRTGGDRGLGDSPTPPCPHLPQGGRPHPAQPRPHPADTSAPPLPQSPQTPRRAAELSPQDSPAQRRRGGHGPSSPGDPGRQQGQQQASLLGLRDAGVPTPPQRSLSIDLTQPQPDPPACGGAGGEVILLLDSDEELELQQASVEPPPHSPADERKVLEVSARSCELFPIIDVDADQEASRSPPPRCGLQSGPDEDSSSDASWLGPATPLAARSRDSSSQTQVRGLRARLPAGQAPRPKPRPVLEPKGRPEAAAEAPVPAPQVSASRLTPAAPGNPPCGGLVCRSPGSPRPRGHRRTPPLAPRPLVGGLPDTPPQPGPAQQAPATEVVEVDDSGDEPEAGAPRASSSPLPDSDPPAPGEDGRWPVEPLSPIPIDHLNLGHAVPLGTSILPHPGGAAQKNKLPPKVPITPMPRYSIMETPVLKRELDRFGVRPLPKRQMVLKLKEIFQYTHQTLGSDSEGESPSSAGSQTPAPEAAPGPAPQRSRGPAKTTGPPPGEQRLGSGAPSSVTPAAETPPGSGGDAELPASQGSAAPAAGSSDSSFSSQSSASCEWGPALESAGDEGDEEGGGASQAGATEAALGRYIRSQPALFRRVLQYQPLELAELRAGLRQQGLRVAAGKLLDFLDAQCITFTTAAARKEQLARRRQRRPAARRKGAGAPLSP